MKMPFIRPSDTMILPELKMWKISIEMSNLEYCCLNGLTHGLVFTTHFLFVCYIFWTGLTVKIIMFSFELYSVRKKQNKSIKRVCLANAAVQFCPSGSLLLCVHAFISALLVFLPYLPCWLFLTSSFLCLIWARWSMPCSMCLGWSCTLVSLSH